MRKLTNADIKDLREYERERKDFLAEIIGMKKQRRIALGELMTIVFENAATMRFQIQEMARAEKMLRDEQIEHEIETYNELIPNDGELIGTLFIEITDTNRLQEWFPKLTRIQDYVAVEVGNEPVAGGGDRPRAPDPRGGDHLDGALPPSSGSPTRSARRSRPARWRSW